MQLLKSFVAVAVIVVVAASSSSAQSQLTSPGSAPARQVSLDASFAGLNVGFAVKSSSRTAIGASLGVGGNWLNYMVVSGAHFAEPGGLAYEAKDGRVNKELIDLLRGSVFVRRYFDEGRQIDIGLKASGFAHFDSSDDEPGGGTFIGLNVTGMWWQWRRLRLGSEIDVGRYSEGRPEFGVNVAPVLLRVTFH